MLRELKSVNTDAVDIEQAVALLAFGRTLQSEYAELEIETPEWLGNTIKSLRREITTRNADALEKKLRDLKARRESMESPEARRRKLEAEIKKTEAALAGV